MELANPIYPMRSVIRCKAKQRLMLDMDVMVDRAPRMGRDVSTASDTRMAVDSWIDKGPTMDRADLDRADLDRADLDGDNNDRVGFFDQDCDPAGLDPVSFDPAGLDPVDLDPVSLEAAGLDRVIFDEVLFKELATTLFRSERCDVLYQPCYSTAEACAIEDWVALELAMTYRQIVQQRQNPLVQTLNGLLGDCQK